MNYKEISLLDEILLAKNSDELATPIVDLIKYLSQPQPPVRWDELDAIARTLQERISNIQELMDFDQNGDGDDQPARKIINWFGHLAQTLARYEAYATSANLLIALWNKFGDYQLKLNDPDLHFYRAGIAMYLGQLYLRYGERGDAMWWLLHANADDIIHGEHSGAAHHLLKLAFGIDNTVHDYMLKKYEATKDDGLHARYAEHLVVQLSLNADFARLFSYPSSLTEFPIGRSYASILLSRLDTAEEDSNKKGEALEEFARYLVLLMTGWVPAKNIIHERTQIDSDIVARYVREPESISTSNSRAILIECKNIKTKLNVAQTGYFLFRMTLTQSEVGVLFTKKGLSNKRGSDIEAEHMNALHLLALAFQQNGNIVVVIDMKDLEQIVIGQKTLWTLIDSGIVERRFGRPKSAEIE